MTGSNIRFKTFSALWLFSTNLSKRVESLELAALKLQAHLGASCFLRNHEVGSPTEKLRAIHRIDRKFTALGSTKILRVSLASLECMAPPESALSGLKELVQLSIVALVHENGGVCLGLWADVSDENLSEAEATAVTSLGLLYDKPSYRIYLPVDDRGIVTFKKIQDRRFKNGGEKVIFARTGTSLTVRECPMRRLVGDFLVPLLELALFKNEGRAADLLTQYTVVAIWEAEPQIKNRSRFLQSHGSSLLSVINMDRWGYLRGDISERLGPDLSIDMELGVYPTAEGMAVVCVAGGFEAWRESSRRYNILTRAGTIADILYHYVVFCEWALLECASVRAYLIDFATVSINLERTTWRRIDRNRRRILQDLENFTPEGLTEFSFGQNVLQAVRSQLSIPELLKRLESRRLLLERIIADRTERATQIFIVALNILALGGVALGVSDVIATYQGLPDGSLERMILRGKTLLVGLLLMPTSMAVWKGVRLLCGYLRIASRTAWTRLRLKWHS